ncbi:unnamed protein product [Peronospora effusa]|nr:unnamed protein product [Peronospora effusa]
MTSTISSDIWSVVSITPGCQVLSIMEASGNADDKRLYLLIDLIIRDQANFSHGRLYFRRYLRKFIAQSG